MSIAIFCNFYTPTCDLCGDELCEQYSFEEAVECKNRNGWKSYNQLGDWIDVCPDCQQRYKNMLANRRTAAQDFLGVGK